MFIGPKITTVFRSRWRALAWSAGVLFSVYCMLPSHEDGEDAGSAAASTAMSVPFFGEIGAKPAAPPVSPWAADPPKSPPQPASGQ